MRTCRLRSVQDSDRTVLDGLEDENDKVSHNHNTTYPEAHTIRDTAMKTKQVHAHNGDASAVHQLIHVEPILDRRRLGEVVLFMTRRTNVKDKRFLKRRKAFVTYRG